MLLALAAAGCLSSPATVLAHGTTGGTSTPKRPQIKGLECDTVDEQHCHSGEMLRVDGEFLESTDAVLFLGGRGRADNRSARPSQMSSHRVLVRVPNGAESGPLRVRSRAAGSSRRGPSIEIEPVPLPAATGDGVFPVVGPYDFGSAANGFGAGRNHQGQDILAKCGTPVVAAKPGRVEWVRWQDAAGNYAVVSASDGTGQAYMHLLKPATVKQGQRVAAGQAIGQVGQTGRATACHLHFELWTAPGWYRGGTAVDPLPLLRALAAAR